MNVLFLGTSHVSSESISQIKETIDSFKPDIVCVELDRQRLSGLLKKEKPSYSPKLIFELGLFGYLFAVVGAITQRKFGNMVGTIPGEDMLTAVSVAREQKISVALIDQPIRITMQRISQSFSIKYVFTFISEFFRGIFQSKKMKKELGIESFSLAKAPTKEFVHSALKYLEKKYPAFYQAILVERNEYMFERIKRLSDLNPNFKLLVVVGAAHVPGMQELVRNHYKSSSAQKLV